MKRLREALARLLWRVVSWLADALGGSNVVVVNDYCPGCGTERLSSNECEVCGTLLCGKCRICQDCFDSGHDLCTYCGGDGWGIVGVHWDSDDPINGPYVGETERCPNCHGSGLAKDMTFW